MPALDLPSKPATELHVQFEETLASASRLWVRGRLTGPRLPKASNGTKGSWWSWRRSTPEASEFIPAIVLETRICGQVHKAGVPLRPDGRFEATFAASLPPARRGWRLARNQVSWSNLTAEKCSVVVQPPEDARSAIVVLLPLAAGAGARGAQRLAQSEVARSVTPVLRRLQQEPGGRHAFFYLAGVPAGGESQLAEWALATMTLGWPNGNLVLLPADPSTALGSMAGALDRLRWLFADSLELVVLNLEPALASLLSPLLQSAEDRAHVRHLWKPGDDSANLTTHSVLEPTEAPRFFVRPTRAGLVPRYPVVFCHGMLAFTTLRMALGTDWNSFSPLRAFFRERGFRTLFPNVGPTTGVLARARQLRELINRWTDEPINIVAHSMGGLDARYLVTHLGMAGRVRSLTTIGAPHRGTYMADWFVANFHRRIPLLLALEALGVNVDGFRDCRPSACQAFNESTPDMPGVRYFSFGGSVAPRHVIPPLRRAAALLASVEGPNDGLVSTASARWGEYLGTIRADHFVQTPDLAYTCAGQSFDALEFYVRLLEDLARRGF
jgi:triacylglycerol lipase